MSFFGYWITLSRSIQKAFLNELYKSTARCLRKCGHEFRQLRLKSDVDVGQAFAQSPLQQLWPSDHMRPTVLGGGFACELLCHRVSPAARTEVVKQE
jgi:hypothetical protein